MRLIKLVYLAHGWFLAWHERPLIGDDIEAWQYGPVIRSVYDAFKQYGRKSIKRPTYGEYDMIIDIGLVDLDSEDAPFRPRPIGAQFSEEEKETMEAILQAYGHLNGFQLSDLTHQKDSPWDSIYRMSGRNPFIDEKLIKAHFKQLDQRNQEFLGREA